MSLKAEQTESSLKHTVKYAILEDLRSLWNVGSIFRTADAAGVSLYLTGITGCPPRKEIAKTSLGAEFSVDWRYYAHALDVVPELKAKGLYIVGLERCDRSVSLKDFREGKKQGQSLALIVGNEVAGISPETLSYCDAIIDLPMEGKKESLNAAVAFGIAAYALQFF
jgi:tRNA G18 (ribose-2'-O)-methylase SpoU